MPRTASPSPAATLAYLHAHGLSVAAQAFEPMVEQAIESLQRRLYRPDPRADLTAGEAAALERGGFELEPTGGAAAEGDDPLARTVADYAALLETGLTTAEAAARLGVDPSRVRQMLIADPPHLYGIRTRAGWSLPHFQFDGGKLVPGAGKVLGRIDPELHPVAVYRWFTSANPDLVDERLSPRPLAPREWLLLGLAPDPVAELAADL
jgi:hypothetical protein